jgi:hypothetical protein
MTTKKQQNFRAALIKLRDSESESISWFWINPSTGTRLSPKFDEQKYAEEWFDRVISIHNETYEFLDRVKNGRFYTLKGRIDIGDTISSKKANECPFTMHLNDDILELEVLSTSFENAKERAEEYFEILEWIE